MRRAGASGTVGTPNFVEFECLDKAVEAASENTVGLGPAPGLEILVNTDGQGDEFDTVVSTLENTVGLGTASELEPLDCALSSEGVFDQSCQTVCHPRLHPKHIESSSSLSVGRACGVSSAGLGGVSVWGRGLLRSAFLLSWLWFGRGWEHVWDPHAGDTWW